MLDKRVYNELNILKGDEREATYACLYRELPDGVRQQNRKAFRSGAANDEFDGYARYSGISWPKGKLGGNAGIYSRPFSGTGVFFIIFLQESFPCGSLMSERCNV